MTNPENWQAHLDKISKIRDEKEMIEAVNGVYPGWIASVHSEYSSDYPFLTENWKNVSLNLKMTRKKILLVTHIFIDVPKDDGNEFIFYLGEILIANGFVLRRICEFEECKDCGKLLPSEDNYNFMKEHNAPVPEKYSDKCSEHF